MSAFGDWWVKTRNEVEAELQALALATEPAVKQALVQAAQAGAKAALTTSGSAGDRWVAARNTAEAILLAQGKSVGAALLTAALTQEMASTPTPTAS